MHDERCIGKHRGANDINRRKKLKDAREKGDWKRAISTR